MESSGLTQVSWGITVNPAAGTEHVLPRIGTGPGTVAGFIVPSVGVIARMATIIDNYNVEWVAGTLEIRIYVNGVQAYTTGALLRTAYSTQARGGDGTIEGYLMSIPGVAVQEGDFVNVSATTGALNAGAQDGPVVDLFFRWE